MELDIFNLVMLTVLGFIGAFINAIVGGGGLITVPALLAVGLPPATAIGTNKLAAALGNLTSMLTFLRAGKVNVRQLAPILPLVFIGSMCGALVIHLLPSEILRPLIILLLVAVLIYSILKKDLGQVRTGQRVSSRKKWLGYLLLIGLGLYDGFFGPGTGSFMIFVLLFMGFDFMQAAGNAKLLNLASNLAALIVFLFHGTVHFSYGIVLGLSMVVGAYVGSRLALSKGTGFVRVLFILITAALVIKTIYDYYVA